MEASATQPTAHEGADVGAEALPGSATVAGAQLALVRGVKRGLDVVVSGLLLAALLPVLCTVAVLVRLDSTGPSFIRCMRVGYRGRPLQMLKFRKMVADATGAPLTTADDARFTRLGRWLTKYKFDELPQLWHVLKGEMSLIGPRPESPDFVERHADDYYGSILTVRPGVIGLSQIAFAEENRVLDSQDPVGHYIQTILPQKVGLDRMYATRLSLWLDLQILFWGCVTVLLRRQVAVDRDVARMTLRRR